MQQQQRVQQVGEMLTIQAAADLLGLKYGAMWMRLRRKRVPTIIIGHTVLVRKEDVQQLQQ